MRAHVRHLGLCLAALLLSLALVNAAAPAATTDAGHGHAGHAHDSKPKPSAAPAPAPAPADAHGSHEHGSHEHEGKSLYRKDRRCGPLFPAEGSPAGALCNANSSYPCCSADGYCGSGAKFCKCFGCVDYNNQCSGNGYIHGDHCHCNPGYGIPYFKDAYNHKRDRTACVACSGVGKLTNKTVCVCDKGFRNPVNRTDRCEAIPPPDAPAVTSTCSKDSPTPTDMYRTDFRCGPRHPLLNGTAAWCHPGSALFCCSPKGFCGNTAAHCTSPGSINYRGVSSDWPRCKPIVIKKKN